MEPNNRALKNPNLQPTDDYSAVYANNINFEPTAFDLKILFGELNQSFEPLAVDQHTAVTISWLEAKLLSYFLRVQLAAFELTNGKISVPSAVLPPEPPVPTDKDLEENPNNQKIYEKVAKLRQEFLETI